MPSLPNDDYMVGWICALPVERAAAEAMLDEVHDKPRRQVSSDHNLYTLGRIGDHNVVITCLPAGVYGTNPTATVVAKMQASFEQIKIGLMVGIGGGIPNAKEDIHLGDVVISKPGGTFGGVVQYDHGKIVEADFNRTGSLNKPPLAILAAVSMMETNHEKGENRISEFLADMVRKHPKMRKKFLYPGPQHDPVCVTEGRSVGDESTNESRGVTNSNHRSPVIHYGLIASGNLVIKDAATRDRLREELGCDVLCFEMEAAGVMDTFPCVVIRGISDYADYHKNDVWQGYAAATAAACAKELLSIIPRGGIAVTLTAPEVTDYITTVRPLARSLFRSCMNSSDLFKQFQNELSTLVALLEAVEESSIDLHINIDVDPTLRSLSHECRQTLQRLQDLKADYDGVGTLSEVIRDWRSEELEDVRAKLSSYITTLTLFRTNMMSASQGKIEKMLGTLIDDVRAGKRKSSVVSAQTMGSLSAEEKEAWRDLRKELESIGITPTLFTQHRELIVGKLQNAFTEYDLGGDVTDGNATMTEADRETLPISRPRNTVSSQPNLPATDNSLQPLAQPQTSVSEAPPIVGSERSHRPSAIARILSRKPSTRKGLVHAAKSGAATEAKHLLEKGAKVNSKDEFGRTSLSWAAFEGHEAVVKLLLARHDVEADSKDAWGRTPLSWAAESGRKAVVKLLVARGDVEVDPKDEQGQTPLSRAAMNGHEPVVKLLVEGQGVEVDSNDEQGQTPLSWAAKNGHKAVVQLLAAHDDVNPDSRDGWGRTPLSWAAEYGHKAVVNLLAARRDVDADSKDRSGRTPLLWAAMNGHEGVVKLLMARDNVEVDTKDRTGRTALLWAAMMGNEAVVKLLMACNDVEADSKDGWGRTPLSWAAMNGHLAVVQLLVARPGVEADSKDDLGRTPLSWAAMKGHVAVVQLLVVRHGVEAHSKDDLGRTPLSWARTNGHEAVVEFLGSTNLSRII